jgi:hypothetical protein
MKAIVVAMACAVVWAAQGPAAGTITRMERGSAREVPLRAAAERWRSAVVARDVRDIVRSAVPEERPLLERALRVPASPAAQALWGSVTGPRPAARTFFRAQHGRPEIVVFSREVLAASQKQALGDRTEYATTCFYREARSWPATSFELQRLDDWTHVLCLDWIRDRDPGV